MELYRDTENYKLYNGSVVDICSVIDTGSVDCIITDPPYELNFMSKDWDNAGVSFNKQTWEQCLKVLKPGGYLLAFGGTRTYHRIACAIEDAGFEIRDCIMWLYGSGFPKSMNIGLALDRKLGVESKVVGQNQQILTKQAKDLKTGHRKIADSYNLGASERNNGFTNVSADILKPTSPLAEQWEGWGTCLKPAYEPIIVARKPFNGSLLDNIEKYKVGALNIDGCRIPLEENYQIKTTNRKAREDGTVFDNNHSGFNSENNNTASANPNGRFPANVIFTYDETDENEVCGGLPYSERQNGSISKPYKINNQVYGDYGYCNTWEAYNDSGSVARYFYCAKASGKDREEGLDYTVDGEINRKNTHPTVKPTELMQYLIRLVAPQNAIILDPFMGSGSTGKAVMFENRENHKNYKFIGIELDKEYVSLANARIHYAMDYTYDYEKLKEENVNIEPKREQYKLF